MTAPVTVIVAYDLLFFEKLRKLFPHSPGMADLFAKNPQLVETTAKRNSSLQGAYLILAARALGLDCGPLSGFDNPKIDEEFFNAGRECEGCDQEFFSGGSCPIELPVQPRIRRSVEAVPAQPAAEVRGGLHAAVKRFTRKLGEARLLLRAELLLDAIEDRVAAGGDPGATAKHGDEGCMLSVLGALKIGDARRQPHECGGEIPALILRDADDANSGHVFIRRTDHLPRRSDAAQEPS